MAGLTIDKISLGDFDIPGMEIPNLPDDDDIIQANKTLTNEEKRRRWLQDFAITGISGDAGDGKSLLMTRFATQFSEMSGTIYTMPGYDLKNAKGEIISKSISVEDWVELPDWLSDCLVCIDEIEDHFNAQSWQSILVRLFTGVFGQNRKRNLGIIYTLQYFEELPKLMRRKTRYIYECTDSAKYNEIKIANGDKPNTPGEMTYTNILDNHGKKWPFIRGYRHPGPIYHNRKYWSRYETETKTDIMSQFTKVEIKRKVVTVDLNGDGVTTAAESIESQRLYENAKLKVNTEREKHNGILTNAQFWAAIGQSKDSPIGRKIASDLIEELNIEKDSRYYRFPERELARA